MNEESTRKGDGLTAVEQAQFVAADLVIVEHQTQGSHRLAALPCSGKKEGTVLDNAGGGTQPSGSGKIGKRPPVHSPKQGVQCEGGTQFEIKLFFVDRDPEFLARPAQVDPAAIGDWEILLAARSQLH